MNPAAQLNPLTDGMRDAWVWFQQDVMGIGFISVILVMLMMALVLTWVLRPSPIRPLEEEETTTVSVKPVMPPPSSSDAAFASVSMDSPPQIPTARHALQGPLANEALELLVSLAEEVAELQRQVRTLEARVNKQATSLEEAGRQQAALRHQVEQLQERHQAELAALQADLRSEALHQQATAMAEAAAARAAEPRHGARTTLSPASVPDNSPSTVPLAKPLPLSEDPQVVFQHALSLVANGATAQELVDQCGLSRPEAQLIVLVHGRSSQA